MNQTLTAIRDKKSSYNMVTTLKDKNGYDTIGCRNVNSYNAIITHKRISKRWKAI